MGKVTDPESGMACFLAGLRSIGRKRRCLQHTPSSTFSPRPSTRLRAKPGTGRRMRGGGFTLGFTSSWELHGRSLQKTGQAQAGWSKPGHGHTRSILLETAGRMDGKGSTRCFWQLQKADKRGGRQTQEPQRGVGWKTLAKALRLLMASYTPRTPVSALYLTATHPSHPFPTGHGSLCRGSGQQRLRSPSISQHLPAGSGIG